MPFGTVSPQIDLIFLVRWSFFINNKYTDNETIFVNSNDSEQILFFYRRQYLLLIANKCIRLIVNCLQFLCACQVMIDMPECVQNIKYFREIGTCSNVKLNNHNNTFFSAMCMGTAVKIHNNCLGSGFYSSLQK